VSKSEVYSWRVSSRLKAELEDAARAERTSVAALLDEIAREWLARSRDQGIDDDERQRQLREAAMPWVGAIAGSDPARAEHASSLARSRIGRRHAR
jgi:hypothetical protein